MFRLTLIIAVLICSYSSWAQSVPDLFRYEDLISSDAEAKEYYSSLSRRFINGNLDEPVWDNKKSDSPRLSYPAFAAILTTLQKFFTLNPPLVDRLPEYPAIRPFTLNNDGSVKIVDDASIESWWRILDKLIEVKRVSGSEEIPELIGALNRNRIEANFENLIEPLIAAQISDGLFHRILRERNTLSPSDQYQVLESIVAKALNQAKALQLPGKYLNKFWEYAFLKNIRRTNIFRKGITIVPMNRFEAITKGIGPGECVRYVCNRYLQALFKDSFFIKVLVDGRESGFIGIDKATDSSGTKVWLIEGIQSSKVATRLGGLVQHLQELASEDGSVLASPNHLIWTFNYPNVREEMQKILGPSSDRTKLQVQFQTPEDIAVFENFVKYHLPQFDEEFMNNRYGIANRLANAIHLLGSGRGFLIPENSCMGELK